ncbi:hypothetical protein [Bacillus bingmayongensis]|uniref:hypothetical protein n=1 Tax=Bacillus bingmayongensis TaxID=1150157 RepID=UPI000369C152|nr:hypothetical protein [Bacillus bingmayongensis]MBY0598965.1 hypothetical protein [Bacillus bingmayongensis]
MLSIADEDDIKKKCLKPCITAYIAHPKVASLAERDVWLGNDETHYVRKWEDKDVQDLKLLIKLTVSYIDMELLTEQIELEMRGGFNCSVSLLFWLKVIYIIINTLDRATVKEDM